MNKKLLIALPACLLLIEGAPELTAQDACAPMEVPPVCQPAARITINNQSHTIAPPNICAASGQVIPVNVVPSGTAQIVGKRGWPAGGGSSFTITAPERAGEYDYDVYFGDGSCIDPRITVN